jgi:tetratricopeptide (TPR) repeat protein
MHLRYTPIERYHRMMALASNSADAEALLRNLVVFNDSIGRSAIVGMAPDDMSEEASKAAFATLRAWDAIQSMGVSRRRFWIDPNLRKMFPITHDLRLRQVIHYICAQSTRDRNWISTHQTDLNEALVWARAYQPELAHYLHHKLHHSLKTRTERAQALYDVYATALTLNSRKLRLNVLKQWADEAGDTDNWPIATYFYREAVNFFESGLKHQGYLQRFHSTYGTTAFRHGHLVEAEQSYLAALTIAQSVHWKYQEVSTLWILLEVALARGNLDTAKDYVMQAQAAEPKRRISSYEAGNAAQALGDVAEARSFYAQVLHENQRFSFKSAWAWGQMEYRLGNTEAGCALCRQALLMILTEHEQSAISDLLLWEYETRSRRLEAIRCNQDVLSS